MPTHRTGTPQISVIIPTCQRPEDLQDALKSIARQNIQGAGWETLVIDNDPCSKTVEVVDSFSTQIPNLKYVVEAEPGLLAARHAGMRHANADLLLYADDDIVASPDWVASVLKGFYQHDASIVGGSNLPLYGCPPPDWLDSLWVQDKDVEMLYQYSILKMRKDVPTPGIAWGCNFAIKKKALLAAGGFHPDGCPWNLVHSRSSGETHIYETVLRQGGTSLLMPGATVQHKVSKSRLTLQYLWKRGVAEGATAAATLLRTHGFRKGSFPGGSGAHAVFAKGFVTGFLFQRLACLYDAALVEWLLRSSYLSNAHIPCQPASLTIPDDETLQQIFLQSTSDAQPASIEDALPLAHSIIPGHPKKAQLLAGYALLLTGHTSAGNRMLNLAALDHVCKEPALFIAACFGLNLHHQQDYQTESVRLLHAHEKKLSRAGLPAASKEYNVSVTRLILQELPHNAHPFAIACMEGLHAHLSEPLKDDNSLEYYAYGSEKSKDADQQQIDQLQKLPIEQLYSAAIDKLLQEIITKQYLYNRLCDEQSKDLLVKIALYQSLGHLFVRLPYYRSANRQLREALWQQVAIPGPDSQLNLLLGDITCEATGKYSFFDLTPLGNDLRLYSSDEEIFRHYFAPNYSYQGHECRIRPETDDILFDCGACLADTGVFFADAVGPQGRVVCFEPMPKNQALAQANLEINPHLASRLSVIPAAVSRDHGSYLEFAETGPASYALQGHASSSSIRVPVVSLDRMAQALALPRVDFIKMDIEGSELEALHGAKYILQTYKPRLAICLYHKPADFTEIPAFLDSLALGYRFFLGHHYVNQFETVLYATAGI